MEPATGEGGDPGGDPLPTRTLFYGLFPRPADLAAFDDGRRDSEDGEASSAGSRLEII